MIDVSARDLLQLTVLTNMSSLSCHNLQAKRALSETEWLKFSVLTKLQHLDLGVRPLPIKLYTSFPHLTTMHIQQFRFGRAQYLITMPNLLKLNRLTLKTTATEPFDLLKDIPNPSLLTSLKISGGLGKYTREQVVKFSNLKELSLQYQSFSLETLTALQKLELFVHELPAFDLATNITSLHLDCTPSRDLQPLGSLARLRELTLRMSGPSTNLNFLSAMTRLECLDLTDTRFEPEELRHIHSPHLTYLHAIIDNPQLAHLSHLTQLESIDINNETFMMECVKDLTRLTALSCSRGTIIEDWAYLTALTNLQLLMGFMLPPMVFDRMHPHLTCLALKVPRNTRTTATHHWQN